MIDNIVAVSDPELEQLIQLLPNPTKGDFQINIALENAEEVRIVISDVVGRVWLRPLFKHYSIKIRF